MHLTLSTELLLAAALLSSLLMSTSWAIQTRTHNTAWADVCWSYGVGLVGAFLALLPGPLSPRQLLVAVIAVLWALRLGTHILQRTLKANKEDPRYAVLRQHWQGPLLQWKMFWFLQLQALTVFLLALPIGAAAHNPAPGLTLTDALGALILLAAVIGEGLADRQIKRFAANPANHGKVCATGLWAYSRHPNYFFEIAGWLAYVLIGISLNGSYPWGFLTLIGPLMMYGLLRYLSGVTWLEAHMLRKYGAAYQAYQQRVSMIFPLPQKR